MDLNMLSFWFNIKDKQTVYSYLIKELKLTHLTYTHDDTNHSIVDSKIDLNSIYIYEDVSKYTSDLNSKTPLDGELISKMRKYESTAFDLIYRWRSSLLNNYDYNSIKKLYINLVKYWHHYIKLKSLTLLFIQDIPHSIHEYICFILFKELKLKVIFASVMPLLKNSPPNMYFMSDFNCIYPNFNSDYNFMKSNYKTANFEDILLIDSLKKYYTAYSKETMDQNNVIATEKRVSNLKLIQDRSMIYIKQKQYIKLIRKSFKLLIMNSNSNKLLKTLEKIEVQPNFNEKYVFFPLHLQPESTTTPNAEVFSNLELIVHLVANALPKDTYLYIKEHPAYFMKIEKYDYMTDYRSIDFYKSLDKYENVKIIDHSVSSNELLENCKCLATANGTAGWEALFKEKPVIVFGNIFYSHIDGVYNVKNFEETKRVLESVLNNNFQPISKKNIAVFLKTIEKIVVNAGNDYDLLKITKATDSTHYENDLNICKGIINYYRFNYEEIVS